MLGKYEPLLAPLGSLAIGLSKPPALAFAATPTVSGDWWFGADPAADDGG